MTAPDPPPLLSILIPAWNEGAWIGRTLEALLASGPVAGVEIVVAANACSDDTVAVAAGFGARAAARGWGLVVLDLPQAGKTRALNAGDAAARGAARIYIDADVVVDPGLIPALAAVLSRPGVVYAGGNPGVERAQSALTRAYSRFWLSLPFIAEGVPGCGVYAVNGPARARWGEFPQVVADDAFVRLNFAPAERVRVAEGYRFPMPEGFGALVRVRRRQDRGLAELARAFPDLAAREAPTRPGLRRLAALALRDPAGFAAYAAVALAVRLSGRGTGGGWARGR